MRARCRLVIVVLVPLVFLVAPPAAAGEQPVLYRPPVDAPVVDPFRPPPHPYGPGNRGLDYRTTPGTPVRAAADGTVTFAGPVAGALHVTVGHPDGRRTTYAFLRSVGVVAGQRLHRGDPVGTAGDRLHFGVREGDTYIDPATLLSSPAMHARLVPHGAPPPAVPDDPRRPPEVDPADVAWAGALLRLPAGPCTPADEAAPPVTIRRVAVLVGGLGSSSGNAAIDDLDGAALGYHAGDVIRFSYAGGRVPDRTDRVVRGIEARPYAASDTGGDLVAAGRRLAALVVAVADAAPGVPIDLIGHSQGGLVARLALGLLAQREAPAAGAVETILTIGTPHGGADLAAVARGLDATLLGGDTLDLVEHLAGIDGDAPAIRQLVPGSALLDRLAGEPLPVATRARSIGARTDVVVPASRTRWPGQPHVVVDVPGLNAHDHLPSAPAVQRELRLALAGLPATCESRPDALADAVAGRVVAAAERLAVAGLG